MMVLLFAPDKMRPEKCTASELNYKFTPGGEGNSGLSGPMGIGVYADLHLSFSQLVGWVR